MSGSLKPDLPYVCDEGIVLRAAITGLKTENRREMAAELKEDYRDWEIDMISTYEAPEWEEVRYEPAV